MKSDEIKKGLREIKSFIIDELKNEDSSWRKHEGRDSIEYNSKWLSITVPKNNKVEIELNNGDSYHRTKYNIKDIGLSKMRFNWLIKYNVEKFIKNREQRQKMESLVSGWNSFLTKNKSLNRDKKLEKILNK
jgi:hypothetical protein